MWHPAYLVSWMQIHPQIITHDATCLYEAESRTSNNINAQLLRANPPKKDTEITTETLYIDLCSWEAWFLGTGKNRPHSINFFTLCYVLSSQTKV